MSKKKGFALLAGMVMGMAAGLAAGMFWASPRSKKFKDKTREIFDDFRAHLAPKLKELGKMTAQESCDYIDKAADQYAKAKNLSMETAARLKHQAQRIWKEAKREDEEGA